jgi:hypothetical protein
MRVPASSDPFIRKHEVSAESLSSPCFVAPERPNHSTIRISALAQGEPAGVSWSLLERPFFCWSQLKLAHDGLEREFKYFNRLGAGVCTTCAPGQPKKSIDVKLEQSAQGNADVRTRRHCIEERATPCDRDVDLGFRYDLQCPIPRLRVPTRVTPRSRI